MKKLTLPVTALTAALVLGACGQTPQLAAAPEAGERVDALSSKPAVTSSTANRTSACTALYSGAAASATAQNAVVDPGLSYGSVGTLILSFNTDGVLPSAAGFITSTLGLKQGQGLGVFQNLPMIAIKAPITSGLVSTLKSGLQRYGLLSIYQDRPLRYFLDKSVAFIKADAARATYKVSGKGVGVAVIDSGVDGTQGDFANLVKNVKIAGPLTGLPVGGYVFVDTPNSDLTSGHGTHVASTIGGSGARSGGKYAGVAPGASLVGVGTGDAISILYAVQGFDFVFKPEVKDAYNVRVISNSWGSSGEFAPYNPISIASKRAYDMGMIVNFAAGNEGPNANTHNPYAASPCVASVAAGDKTGYLADFSSRGIPGDPNVRPDITAPGVDIIAARAATGAVTPPYTDDLQYGAFYSSISGTSMATPHMSGVAALMLEANPKLNLDSYLAAVTSTARPMYYSTGTGGGLNPSQAGVKRREAWEVGAGYVDAYAAVKKAVATAGARYTTTTSALKTWSGTVGLAVNAPSAGALVDAEHVYTLSVPSGASALRIKTDWANPAYDLDLYVYAPNGTLIASSAEGASPSESVAIPSPKAGNYRVQLKGYLNAPTTYTGSSEIDKVSQVK